MQYGRNLLAREIATHARVSIAAAERMLTAMETVCKDVVAKGDKVVLRGFFSLSQLKKQQRRGRNPKTGEEVVIPAKTVPKFKAGFDI